MNGRSCDLCPAKTWSTDGRSLKCSNCTLGNGCLDCDQVTGDCTSCPSGFVISGDSCVKHNYVVVIIEFETGSDEVTIDSLKLEIERILGQVSGSVIEISKGKFEVTLIESNADKLIDAVNVCRS